MIRRMFLGLFAFAMISCVVNFDAAAQSADSCKTWYDYQFPEPFMGLSNCTVSGPFLEVCWVYNYTCPPPPPPPCPCGASGGKPISFASGNTYITETDARVPGLSNGLTLVRTWNSYWPAIESASKVGLFGPNWRSNFEERVFQGSDGYYKYSRGDGSLWSFGFWYWGPNGTFVWRTAAPANIVVTLTSGSTYWTMTFPNGEQRHFDNTTGSLTAIIDRNGISSVTSDVGLTLSYSYDSQGRLSTVTNPDQSTLTFTYDSNSLITAVKDSNGKILESHTYDSLGRGLTSSQAGGVNALTTSYH